MKKNKLLLRIGFLFFLILFSVSAQTELSELVLTPPNTSVYVGDTVSVMVSVNSNTPINAVSATMEYSSNLEVLSFSRPNSIVDFWVREPQIQNKNVVFEGVVLNPGFLGNNGAIVQIQFRALREGGASIRFDRGSLLANDGLGTNTLDGFKHAEFTIKPPLPIDISELQDRIDEDESLTALPVISEYSEIVDSKGLIVIRGKGAPNQLTKIRFQDTSFKTLGEQFILWLQPGREKPNDVLVKNNEDGSFEFTSAASVVAGSYNVVPALVDPTTQIEKPGFGVKVLVQQSTIVRLLVVLINILLLLIPVALLLIIIYFIFWYSRIRMRILKHKTDLEDQEIYLSKIRLQKKANHIEDSE